LRKLERVVVDLGPHDSEEVHRTTGQTLHANETAGQRGEEGKLLGRCLDPDATSTTETGKSTREHVKAERVNDGHPRQVKHDLPGLWRCTGETLECVARCRPVDLPLEREYLLPLADALANPQACGTHGPEPNPKASHVRSRGKQLPAPNRR
jgi:hypothetical protein